MSEAEGRRREWQRVRTLGREAVRFELGANRIIVAILIPLGLYAFSPRWAAVAAVPCGLLAGYLIVAALRRFVTKGHLF